MILTNFELIASFFDYARLLVALDIFGRAAAQEEECFVFNKENKA